MIDSVSSVSFKAAAPTYDAISRPGKYTMAPKETVVPEKKNSHKGLKWAVGLAATALTVCGLLIAGNKQGWFRMLDETALKGAGIMDTCKHYLGKAGDFLTQKAWEPTVRFVTETVPNKCKDLWARIKPGKAEEAAANVVA